MDTPADIRSRLSTYALRHLEEAGKVEDYRPFHLSVDDMEGFSQLGEEGLLMPFYPGPHYKLTELGRQVLRAT